MKVNWPIEILGSGAGIPERVIPNQHFADYLDTSDDWIVSRTGIRERRWVHDHQSTTDIAMQAAREALADAKVAPEELDLILCGTVTPEHYVPAMACAIQRELGARVIPAFDVSASCASFVYSMITASQFINGGMARTVLVIGGDCLSRITDMEDRATCILFGDGAAAVVLRKTDNPDKGALSAIAASNGEGERLIWVPAGGSKEPPSHRTVNERLHFLRMQGREVYKFAVVTMQEVVETTLAEAGYTIEDLSLLVPHQSNLRIIESACKKLGLPESRVVVNIDRYGNTSGGSVPLALHEARRAGRVKPGDLVMIVAFGAGLTWASLLLRI